MPERYIIRESRKFIGSYVIVDTETGVETPFYNLASAKTYLKTLKKQCPCEVCECSPCDCNWGN